MARTRGQLQKATPVSCRLEDLRDSPAVAGFSGAEIANVVNEGALIAARNNKDAVGLDDFNAAMDRVIGGLEKKSKVMTPPQALRPLVLGRLTPSSLHSVLARCPGDDR